MEEDLFKCSVERTLVYSFHHNQTCFKGPEDSFVYFSKKSFSIINMLFSVYVTDRFSKVCFLNY